MWSSPPAQWERFRALGHPLAARDTRVLEHLCPSPPGGGRWPPRQRAAIHSERVAGRCCGFLRLSVHTSKPISLQRYPRPPRVSLWMFAGRNRVLSRWASREPWRPRVGGRDPARAGVASSCLQTVRYVFFLFLFLFCNTHVCDSPLGNTPPREGRVPCLPV